MCKTLETIIPEITVPIVEIFRSLEGEGDAVGTPTIFIRFAGCSVGCVHCDSRSTWDTSAYPQMNIGQIIEQVEALNINQMVRRISITGGEPLEHLEFLIALCTVLRNQSLDYEINLETSGTLFPPQVFQTGITYFDTISLDIKTPASGVHLDSTQISHLKHSAQYTNVYIKAVIAAPNDLHFVLDILKGLNVFNLVLTPCEIEGKFFPVDKIYEVLDERGHNLYTQPLRIISQQHKTQNYR
jgi:7-carboxy-7-deazaguanine synthase